MGQCLVNPGTVTGAERRPGPIRPSEQHPVATSLVAATEGRPTEPGAPGQEIIVILHLCFRFPAGIRDNTPFPAYAPIPGRDALSCSASHGHFSCSGMRPRGPHDPQD